eukprot:14821055-Ditylum_brightwellii.AAC.1
MMIQGRYTFNTIQMQIQEEVARKFQEKYGSLAKENLPLKAKIYPELDDSPLLNKEDHKHYQHIIGVGQWLIVLGHFDLTYAVSSLSRFSAAPRKGHLDLARK